MESEIHQQEQSMAQLKEDTRDKRGEKRKPDRKEGEKEQQKKRIRIHYSKEKLYILESVYAKDQYPDKLLREEMAAHLGITETKVYNWFQNRHVKEKRLKNARAPVIPDSNTCTLHHVTTNFYRPNPGGSFADGPWSFIN